MEITRRIAVKALGIVDDDCLEFDGIREGWSYWYSHETQQACRIDPLGERRARRSGLFPRGNGQSGRWSKRAPEGRR